MTAHSHEHGDGDMLDQVCLITLTAAFGGICLSLYFWQKHMFVLMLAGQFHPWVLFSGLVLTCMAGIRAAVLWRSRPTNTAHACCDHEHDHHGTCHEHHSAPWRYMVLLVPILLILLGFPNKGPEVRAVPVNLDLTHETTGYAALVGSGVDPWQQLLAGAALSIEPSFEPPVLVEFKTLLTAPLDKHARDHWKRRRIRVTGQFQPSPASEHLFNLVGFRIRCCGSDATPIPVPAICKQDLPNIRSGEWVQITGRMDFFPVGPEPFQDLS